jgi:hypothetical protein
MFFFPFYNSSLIWWISRLSMARQFRSAHPVILVLILSSSSFTISYVIGPDSCDGLDHRSKAVPDNVVVAPIRTHDLPDFGSNAKQASRNSSLAFSISETSPFISKHLYGATGALLESLSCNGHPKSSGRRKMHTNRLPSISTGPGSQRWHPRTRMQFLQAAVVTCGAARGFGCIPHAGVQQCPSPPSFSSPPTILRVRGGGWLNWCSTAPEIPRKEAQSSAPDSRAPPKARNDASLDSDGAPSRGVATWWERNR